MVIILTKRDADVYAALVRSYNGTPTYAEIAKKTGHAPMTVKRAVHTLMEQGIIGAEHAPGQGQRTPIRHGSIVILMTPTEVLLRMEVEAARAVILELAHEERQVGTDQPVAERLLEASQ